MIYLDNAATSWPKPPQVIKAMVDFFENVGANPGRSGHRKSVEAGRIINDARECLAELLGLENPLRVVFGLNATEGLNTAVNGLLRPGDHVITTSMEHNSMMRPLRALEEDGVIELTVLPVSPRGELDPDLARKAITGKTRLVAVNHASNVTGAILPVAEMGRIARENDILLLVDAAQSAGALPISMERDNIDLLAFTGHKSLLGPTGTGGLLIGPRVNADELRPLKRGGTGSRSEHEYQPSFLPDKLESGTLNAGGIAGLLAGVTWLLERGIKTVRNHEKQLVGRLIQGVETIPGVTTFRGPDIETQAGTISIIIDGISPSEVGLRLDEEFGIMSRVGLHCAPSAHRTIGSFPSGTVRLAIGPFTTPEEVDKTILAVATLATGK